MSHIREPAQLGNSPLSGCRLPRYVLLWLKGLGELLGLFSKGTDLIPESSLLRTLSPPKGPTSHYYHDLGQQVFNV